MSRSIEILKSENYRRGLMMMGVAFLAGASVSAAIFVGLMQRSYDADVRQCVAGWDQALSLSHQCSNVLQRCANELERASVPGRDL